MFCIIGRCLCICFKPILWLFHLFLKICLYIYLYHYENSCFGEGKTRIRAINQYRKKLDEYCKLVEKYLPEGIHCVFRSDIPVSRTKTLIAELHFLQKEIVFNEEWAKILLFHSDESILNAFKLTVGHEYTHFDERQILIANNKGKRKSSDSLDEQSIVFKNWLSEVHADFGGAELMLNANRKCATNAQEIKEQWINELKSEKSKPKEKDKKNKKKNNEACNSHPKMDDRIKYLDENDFNESLIRRIAKDAKCTDVTFIDEMCKFYEGQEIILH